MPTILSPPIAFLIYSAVILALLRLNTRPSRRTDLYAGGEVHPEPDLPGQSGPGGSTTYFSTALFFAVLHLGVLVLATGAPPALGLIYLGGLAVTLVMLLMG